MTNIAVFASGTGSNAENIIKHFQHNKNIQVTLIVSNRAESMALSRAEKLGVEALYVTKEDFVNGKIIDILNERDIEFIILAGFLMLIPSNIVQKFNNRILNIHPALLPKFGGKGMFGDNVHKAVVESLETKTGITVHVVDERYDQGAIIFQAECDVLPEDNYEHIAEKVHTLEYKHFPEVIEDYIYKTDFKR